MFIKYVWIRFQNGFHLGHDLHMVLPHWLFPSIISSILCNLLWYFIQLLITLFVYFLWWFNFQRFIHLWGIIVLNWFIICKKLLKLQTLTWDIKPCLWRVHAFWNQINLLINLFRLFLRKCCNAASFFVHIRFQWHVLIFDHFFYFHNL